MSVSILNSILVGTNRYLLETNESAESFLERGVVDGRYQYVPCKGIKSGSLYWAIPITYDSAYQMEALMESLEKAQDIWFFGTEIICPMDLATVPGLNALIINPMDPARYDPIRSVLPLQTRACWRYSIQLFQIIKELHENGVSLGGFCREQIYIDRNTDRLALFPGIYMAPLDMHDLPEACRGSYLSIPSRTEKLFVDSNKQINRLHRDIFSAAVLSFYLLFCEHPFIGSRFWSLVPEEYLQGYLWHPEFIFDSDGGNQMGVMAFERYIKERWGSVSYELKALYVRLFTWFLRPDKYVNDIRDDMPVFDPDYWIKTLESDEIADDFSNLTPYDFTGVKLYLV